MCLTSINLFFILRFFYFYLLRLQQTNIGSLQEQVLPKEEDTDGCPIRTKRTEQCARVFRNNSVARKCFLQYRGVAGIFPWGSKCSLLVDRLGRTSDCYIEVEKNGSSIQGKHVLPLIVERFIIRDRLSLSISMKILKRWI